MFARRRNRLTTHFSERIPIVNPLTPNDAIWVVPHRSPPDAAIYIFIQQIRVYVLNILNMLNNLFFSSKCRLFHYATFFGSCIIHILNTGCAKI